MLRVPAEPVDGAPATPAPNFTARGRAVVDAYGQAYAIPPGATRTVVLKVVDLRRLRGRDNVTGALDRTHGYRSALPCEAEACRSAPMAS